MRTRELSRRRFLRGAAGGAVVSVALPRLGAMLDGQGRAWAAGGTRPVRYVTWAFGNGVVPALWIPKGIGAGASWQLSPALAPLAPWKSHLTVLGNMKVEGSSQHGCGNTFFVTGAKATTKREPLATSIDQVIAAETRKQTPLRSLELGVVNAPEDEEPGRLAWSHNGPGSSNYPSYDVGELFDRLFGPNGVGARIGGTAGATTAPAGATPPPAVRSARKSVLDFVLADARRLRGALPPADRARLDQHLEGVFALEQRIAAAEAGPSGGAAACRAPTVKRMVGGGKLDVQSAEANRAMASLLALAFACDLTRVATYHLTQAGSKAQMPEAGVSDWHALSHEPEQKEKIQRVVLRHMEYLAELVKALAETPDGDGTLLDNLVLMTVNDVAEGWDHSGGDMPVLLVGKGGGRLRGDVHHRGAPDFASVACLTAARAVIQLPAFGVGAYRRTEPLAPVMAPGA